MTLYALFLLILVLAAGCTSSENEPLIERPEGNNSASANASALPDSGTQECVTDADCTTAGCSGQLCVPQEKAGIITTCEFREDYACLSETKCGCQQGKCAFAQTPAYISCLQRA